MLFNMQPFFMKTAFLLSERSHCVSHKVGALIVKDNRIVSIGYNGSPPDAPHCDKVFDHANFDRDEHTKWSEANEIHAEINALAFAAKYGLEINDCDMYVTISPCNSCLKNLVMNGIKRLWYFKEYDRSDMNPIMTDRINIRQIHDPNNEIEKFIKLNNLFYEPLK